MRKAIRLLFSTLLFINTAAEKMPTYGTNVPCLGAHLCSLRRKYTLFLRNDQAKTTLFL